MLKPSQELFVKSKTVEEQYHLTDLLYEKEEHLERIKAIDAIIEEAKKAGITFDEKVADEEIKEKDGE